MGRKPRVDRSPEEKWQIVQEGIKSGNVSETCRRHGIAPNLFYRWKDEAASSERWSPDEMIAFLHATFAPLKVSYKVPLRHSRKTNA